MQEIYRRHPCRSVISINLQSSFSNFVEIAFQHECCPVNLLHILEHLFLRTPGWLLLNFLLSKVLLQSSLSLWKRKIIQIAFKVNSILLRQILVLTFLCFLKSFLYVRVCKLNTRNFTYVNNRLQTFETICTLVEVDVTDIWDISVQFICNTKATVHSVRSQEIWKKILELDFKTFHIYWIYPY